MDSKASYQHRTAVVIGGSMAGLLAARVLANHYDRVIIIERDPLPASREIRRGVPQARHTHGLLAGGREALERLFPGISEELIAAGALTGDIVRESRWFLEGGRYCRPVSGLKGLLMSRPFLESAVREHVSRVPNVQIRDGLEVRGLIVSGSGSQITGVEAGSERLDSDLVVDTTGRGSRSVRWLEAMGFPKPQEERVQVDLSYTTRLFRRSRKDLNGDLAVIIPPTPQGKCGGVMLAQEDDLWTVTLISEFGPPAPGELDGFIEFAKALPAPDIHEVISSAEPIGAAAPFRFRASVRRHYEKLSRLPLGYVAMGDALSSFNPIYGQGMTVAALEALALDSVLSNNPRDLARHFYQRASKVVDTPWSIAVGNDLRIPETVGRRSLGVRFVNSYIARLHRAAHRDPAVAIAFHQVGNLVKPPAHIMRPAIAWRVLWGGFGEHGKPSLARNAQESTLHQGI
ncbi:MAG: FAD-dependent oxidoreductase [Bryobacteraceae bacterium]